MRRLIVLFGYLLLLVAPALAQQTTAPDYTAFWIARLLSDDGTQVEAEFQVFNAGGDATEPAVVELRELGNSTLLASGEVPPLAAGTSEDILLTFPLSALPDVQPETKNVIFELTIRSPEFDPVRRLAEFTIPAGEQPPPVQPPPAGDSLNWLTNTQAQIESWLAFLPFEVNLGDPVQLAALIGVLVFLVVILWLFSIIFRLIFIPQPTFPANPPPYAGMPAMNPDSLGGRRQMWQQVAQHGSMFAQQQEGNLHARKLLTDTGGNRYSGWKVVGMRASQYDTYGRVSRTQVIAPRGLLRRLNRVLAQAPTIDEKAAHRRVRPVAKALVNKLNRRINKRGAALPVALDVKFRGEHGEVNILFELYQFQLGAWRRLDTWQPEMFIQGKSIYESYTYTIFGLQEDETMRQFRKRLREDVTYLLAEMVLCTPPASPASVTATQEAQQPVATQTKVNQSPDDVFAPPVTSSMRPVPPPQEQDEDDEDDMMDTVVHDNDSVPES